MPVANGDRFAAIVLGSVRPINLPAPAQVSNELSIEAGLVVPLDDKWINWMGQGRVDAFGDDSVTFLAKRAAPNPTVVDAISRDLQRVVYSFFYGCL